MKQKEAQAASVQQEKTDMELPERKHPRLKDYDYSSSGYYHIVINTQDNLPILSRVGRGLAPAEEITVHLSSIGKIAEKQLYELKERFPYVEIDNYAIMPNHIHAIIILKEDETAGASPRPTVPDIICAYKSLVTRLANKADNTPGRKIFQTSFFDSVIRNDKNYLEALRYIDENPLKHLLKKNKLL